MKLYYLFFLCSSCICSSSFSQELAAKPGVKPEPKIEKYCFVMIKTGKNSFDSTERTKLFKGHMENMGRLHKEGILKVAGPFGKNDNSWRGIFILDCKTYEEAKEYTNSDPAVAAGLFAVDIVPWYSEATGSFTHGKPEKDK